MPRVDYIQMRRGTAAAWGITNPVLGAGEPGFESDTFKMKVGNGTLAWNDLPYLKVDPPASPPAPARVRHFIPTYESSALTAWSDLTTVGPQCTLEVPASGQVEFHMAAQVVPPSNVFWEMCIDISGATVRAVDYDDRFMTSGNGVLNARWGISGIIEGLTAGSTTFTVKYRSPDAAAIGYLRRSLAVVALP